jgi:hypothetical protein
MFCYEKWSVEESLLFGGICDVLLTGSKLLKNSDIFAACLEKKAFSFCRIENQI